MALDAQQRAAVEAVCLLPPGILRLRAAAGSGKTRTAVAAIATVLKRQLLPPTGVIVLTFSANAATELRARFAALGWGKKALPAIGTYHSLARAALGGARWPMDRCVDVGGKSQLVPTAHVLWERLCDEGAVFPTKLRGCNTRAALEKAGVKPQTYGTVIGALRGFGATPEDWTCASPLARATAAELPDLRGVWRRYDEVKAAVGGWDFEDLLEAWERTLRKAGGGGYGLVLVDEAQDNTPRQNVIAVGLARDCEGGCGTIVRVGDPFQAIYGFRGSAPEHFDAPLGQVPLLPGMPLATNYRSGVAIVAAGNAVVAAEAYAASTAAPGAVWGLLAAHAGDQPELLAEVLGRREGAEHGEWAVLCRTNALVYQCAATLIGAGIPARGFGGVPPQVLTLAAYLQVLHPPPKGTPGGAWRMVASRPGRYYSRRGLDMLAEALAPARVLGIEWAAICERVRKAGVAADGTTNGSQTRAASALVADLDRLRGASGLRAQARAIVRLCCPGYADAGGDSGGAGELAGDLPDADAQAGWTLGLDLVGRAVAEALAGNAAAAGVSPAEAALAAFRRAVRALDAVAEVGVHVSTIHAAKGLEWPRVAVLTAPGSFPHEPRRQLGPAAARALAEEERRLLYVAATRPQHELLVLAARTSGRRERGGDSGGDSGVPHAVRWNKASVLAYLRTLALP